MAAPAGTNYGVAVGSTTYVLTNAAGNAVLVLGTSPFSTGAGFSIGCIGIDTTSGITYCNTGTASAASFVKVSST